MRGVAGQTQDCNQPFNGSFSCKKAAQDMAEEGAMKAATELKAVKDVAEKELLACKRKMTKDINKLQAEMQVLSARTLEAESRARVLQQRYDEVQSRAQKLQNSATTAHSDLAAVREATAVEVGSLREQLRLARAR